MTEINSLIVIMISIWKPLLDIINFKEFITPTPPPPPFLPKLFEFRVLSPFRLWQNSNLTPTGLWCINAECGLLSTESFLQTISLRGTPAGVRLELLQSAELAHDTGLGDCFHDNRGLLVVATGFSLTFKQINQFEKDLTIKVIKITKLW